MNGEGGEQKAWKDRENKSVLNFCLQFFKNAILIILENGNHLISTSEMLVFSFL